MKNLKRIIRTLICVTMVAVFVVGCKETANNGADGKQIAAKNTAAGEEISVNIPLKLFFKYISLSEYIKYFIVF